MQIYLNQLRADIAALTAKRHAATRIEADDSFNNHIQEIERYLHETPVRTFAQHIGLEKIQFPPAEQLTLTLHQLIVHPY